ncbi:hypothetical protein WA026_007864 [Henosepilachna vigintioctopunctata]|uniref:Carboxylic ester hydrolase n=1 Tax=Henosepilachna vigintioctopunctata TaxID=420089 RepID=A0AAW1TV80_9CUCU
MFFNFIGKEDNCLNLNVYTKEMPKDSDPPKPVMVFIHGGGFIQGSNSKEFYNPSYLMTQNVIQVIINYRLGILGFLCLEDDSLGVMGNAGLKDQVMALKWVKENISSFGGDPNNVTIYGESAGSASVHYHLLSPASKGLFHKAILQSGCALNPWASGQRGTASLTKYLDIKDTEDKKILEKLQKMCLKKIVSAQMRVPEFFQGSVQRPYGPVIEHPSDEAFLVESPLKILKDGTYNQVPVIVGLNSNEGMLFEFVRVLHKIKGPIDCEMEVPFDMGLAPKTEVTSLIGEKIRKFYKLDEGSDEDKLDAVHKLKADLQFVHGVHRFVNLQLLTNENPMYYYIFSFEGELNYFKKLATSKSTIPFFFMHYLMNKTGMKGVFRKLGNSFGFRNIPGVCHADDLGYLFATFFTPSVSKNSREEVMIKRLVALWTNFAKFGNPTPPNDDNLSVSWTPAEKENLHFLNIADELKMESCPFKERNVFWDDIYKEYSKN